MNIILGSSSRQRRDVLGALGCQFLTMSPDIDEKAIRSTNLYELPSLIARAKKEALISRVTQSALLITADQIVVCDGKLYEKPENKDDVRNVFKKYSAGHPAETVSAVVVTNTLTGKSLDGLDIARVYFKPVPSDVVERFIDTKGPFGNAGAFDIASTELIPYIDRIDGTVDSVMGLPLALLRDLIKKLQ